MKEILDHISLVYKKNTMKHIVLKNRTNEKFEEWSSFCTRLSKYLDCQIMPGGNAFQPCFSAQVEIMKIYKPPFQCKKSLVLLKSFIEPYWCIYGMFQAFDGAFPDKNLPKADVRYQPSIIFSKKPEYDAYNSEIKKSVLSEFVNSNFLDPSSLFNNELKEKIPLYSNSIFCPEPKLYNYIFDSITLDKFHVI